MQVPRGRKRQECWPLTQAPLVSGRLYLVPYRANRIGLCLDCIGEIRKGLVGGDFHMAVIEIRLVVRVGGRMLLVHRRPEE